MMGLEILYIAINIFLGTFGTIVGFCISFQKMIKSMLKSTEPETKAINTDWR